MKIRKRFLFFALVSLSWVNWTGNQSCTPKHYLEPKNLAEISTAVQQAASNGYNIRVVGSGYSVSALVPTEGVLLNLKHLNKILAVDSKNKCVHVECGITLRELNEELAALNLALPNQISIDTLTLGGALATASHGTGHTGTLSSFIKKIDLITADGSLHELSLTSDPEAFSAAKVSLGALGVLYAVTIQCEPLFYLKELREESDLETLLESYLKLNKENDFFQFAWNIENDKVDLYKWNRAKQGEPCYQVLTFHTLDENDKDLFSEIAVPVEALPKAIAKVKEFLKNYQDIKIADIVIRFVETDENAYLSPSSGHPVAYMTMSITLENSPRFYQEFENLLAEFQGRPHWGKINFLDHKKAKALYGPNLEKFVKVKERLDPKGVFSNGFLKQIWEPIPDPIE